MRGASSRSRKEDLLHERMRRGQGAGRDGETGDLQEEKGQPANIEEVRLSCRNTSGRAWTYNGFAASTGIAHT